MNHLLKSPFSVHPKTGRLSVPFDAEQVDTFDPLRDVPTVSTLADELHRVQQAALQEASHSNADDSPAPMDVDGENGVSSLPTPTHTAFPLKRFKGIQQF